MPLPTDPLLASQWHLGNPVAGLLDLNVRRVWNPAEGAAYTGAGTRTVVIDDGFDYNHVDLAPNYNTALDFDYNTSTLDPFGGPSNAHGTAVAGIIGAAANGVGAVGVAFGTELVGYRTHGFINDFWLTNIRDSIAQAATNALADVTNISQGIANDTDSEFGFGYNALRFDEIETSIGTAVNSGRGGLGMTIVKSAGNSRDADFDVNADDWTNDTRQVVVSAVDQDGFVSFYSSYGAAVLVSGFGTPGEVVTTDRSGAAGYDAGDYTSGFNGTSSAAPMVSGVVSLMYDAEAGLGWRDVQTILGVSARHVGSDVGAGIAGSERYAWGFNGANTWNGGGQHFSNDYGYGLADAWAAVRLAESWLLTGTAAATSGNEFSNTMDLLNTSTVITPGGTGVTFSANALFDDSVERVTVQVSFATTFVGDVEIYLISPDGTTSELINQNGGSADFNGTWTFESQAFRGERAAGNWSVRIVDADSLDTLTVSDIIVKTYGGTSRDDRYVFTDEYSDYAGLFGHVTAIDDTNTGTDTVNAAAVSTASNIRLDGTVGTIDGIAVTFASIENAIGGDGNDTLQGSSLANKLFGMRGADYIDGGNGDDSLYGGTGNDTLSQNSGNSVELIDGGDGTDTGDWGYSFSNWTISLVSNTAKLGATLYANLTSIENVSGGTGNDTITGDGQNNLLEGRNGADSLNGGNGRDSLFGGSGNDTLSQNFGGPNEVLDGGADTDTADWSYSILDSWTIDLNSGLAITGSTTFADLISIENVVGGQAADVLLGNGEANRLDGQAGNDSLNGGDGTDSLYGGIGNDTLTQNFGGPNEVLDGGANTDTASWAYSLFDTWTIDLVANTATLGGPTVFAQLTSIENVVGGQSGDVIIGNTEANVLDGQNGADSITGGGGTDTVNGGEGNDTIVSGGEGTYSGDAGNDLMYAGSTIGGETLDGGADNDTLDTTSYNNANLYVINMATGVTSDGETFRNFENIITAGTLDNITGTSGNNRISTRQGNDTLNGGTGNDTMLGGQDNDRYVVSSAGDEVIEELGEGTDTVQSYNVTYTLTDNVERLELAGAAVSGYGNALANTLIGTVNANVLDGRGGSDYMAGGAGDDIYVVDVFTDTVVEGLGAGTDTVRTGMLSYTLGANVERLEMLGLLNATGIGNALANTIIGNQGNNLIDGRAGSDFMAGGLGNDTYYVDVATDTVSEVAAGGTDTVRSTLVSTTLATSVERLELLGAAVTGIGNTVANTIVGTAAANILDGKGGADFLAGGTGDDIYIVDVLADVVSEAAGAGVDTVRSLAASYSLGANVERLELQAGAVTGIGNAVANTLVGNSGANNLQGGLGNDYLLAGAGRDTLTGGGDSDSFAFNATTDSTVGAATRDIIADFTAADTIVLTAVDANGAAVGNGTFGFIGTAAFALGVLGQLRYSVFGTTSIVEADINGDRVADMQIQLNNVTALIAADFAL